MTVKDSYLCTGSTFVLSCGLMISRLYLGSSDRRMGFCKRLFMFLQKRFVYSLGMSVQSAGSLILCVSGTHWEPWIGILMGITVCWRFMPKGSAGDR